MTLQIGETKYVKKEEHTSKIEECFDDVSHWNSGWWWINNRWAIIRNNKSPYWTGSGWKGLLYDIVYIPEKREGEKGYQQEWKNAERFKKKVAILILTGSIGLIFVSLVGGGKALTTFPKTVLSGLVGAVKTVASSTISSMLNATFARSYP